MAIKTSEMTTVRNDLALDLEAGIQEYLGDVAEGYDRFFEPVLEEGETAPDIRFQLELLRRSVVWQRQQLDGIDGDVVDQSGADVTVSAEIQKARDALRAKMGFIRDTCRGVFGAESLPRVGLKGTLTRNPVRLHKKAGDVGRSLRNPASELTPVLAAGEGALTPEQLASELEPELGELGRFVGARRHGRRKSGDVRSRRRRKVAEFDAAVRAIVRMAQGIFRLAGRDDLAARFRPVLQRVIRKLKEQEAKEAAEAQADAASESTASDSEVAPEGGAAAEGTVPEGEVLETAPTDEAAAAEETTA
ncbi:MAG: hypothetical protein GY719_42215 [bacterium]|nr:hypothetical protein [bacterium]